MAINCAWYARNFLFGHPYGDIIALPKGQCNLGDSTTWEAQEKVVKLRCNHVITQEKTVKAIMERQTFEAQQINTKKGALNCPINNCGKLNSFSDYKNYDKLLPTGQGIPPTLVTKLLADNKFVYFVGPKESLCTKLKSILTKIYNFAVKLFKASVNVLHWITFVASKITPPFVPLVNKCVYVVSRIFIFISAIAILLSLPILVPISTCIYGCRQHLELPSIFWSPLIQFMNKLENFTNLDRDYFVMNRPQQTPCSILKG